MNSNEIYVSLDIGTSNVKVIIGELVNDNLNIIGVGNVKSNGLKKGSIVDIDETVGSIKKAIEQAERMVGLQIDSVIVGIGGNHIQLLPCHGVVAVSSENREITTEDVERVLDAAKVMSIPPERTMIDIVPKQFIVDGLDEINDPRGMIGVRLEMEGTLITGSKTNYHNLVKCVERAGLEISNVLPNAVAVSSIALSKDEKYIGAALLDIGGGSTTISVYREGALVGYSVVPLGGDHITKDIAMCLKTSTEDAEKVKLKYGHAYYNSASEDQIFSVPSIGSDQHSQFSQLEISDIIEARLEEIFDFAVLELKKMGVRELPGGFILTGGVVSITGILELAQEMFDTNVRIAIPDYIGVREPQYTNGVGLIYYAHQKNKLSGNSSSTFLRQDNRERVVSAPTTKKVASKSKAKVKSSSDEENVMTKMKKYIRYLWE